MKKIMFNDKYGLTQAVLEGKKTQTRRIVTYPRTFKGKDVAGFYAYRRQSDRAIVELCMYDEDEISIDEGQILPKYKAGEVVAVAQSYKDCGNFPDYELDEDGYPIMSKRSGFFNKMFVRADLMPHRIRITKVRIQQLQDISDEDCLKEGIETFYYGDCKFPSDGYTFDKGKSHFETPHEAFAHLIDKVSGKGTWESNPYVWVYEFELVK